MDGHFNKRKIQQRLLKRCGPNYEKLWFIVYFDGTSVAAFRSRRRAKKELESMYKFTYNINNVLVLTNTAVYNAETKFRLYVLVSGAKIVEYLYKVSSVKKKLNIYVP